MAYSPATINSKAAFSSALTAYITKYCEIVTGSRVRFQGQFTYGQKGWCRFKCTTCQDNWNVGADLFTNTTSCPKELSDWLEKHQHVCNSFRLDYIGSTKCASCGWSWEKHKAAQPVYDIETGVWHAPGLPSDGAAPISIVPYQGRTTGTRECVVCGELISVASGVGICKSCYAMAKAVRKTTTTKAEGRMFRQKETRCELNTDTSEEMSSDSAK